MAHSASDGFYRDAMCVRVGDLGDHVLLSDVIQDLVAERGGSPNVWYERLDRMICLGLLRWARLPRPGDSTGRRHLVALNRWEVEHIARKLDFKTWGLRGILSQIAQAEREAQTPAPTCAHCGCAIAHPVSALWSGYCSRRCRVWATKGAAPDAVPDVTQAQAGAILGVSKQAVQYAQYHGSLPRVLRLRDLHAFANNPRRNRTMGFWHPERAPAHLRDQALSLGPPPPWDELRPTYPVTHLPPRLK